MAERKFVICGRLIDQDTGQGVEGLRIEAWDKDLIFSDLVGSTTTKSDGALRMEFDESYFRECFLDRKPDLFFKIFRGNELIMSTEDSILWNIDAGETEIMIEVGEKTGSRELALKLYDNWVRQRQQRADLRCIESRDILEDDLAEVRKENFASQVVEPRQAHLKHLKDAGDRISTADKVALLVMTELPALEITTLLHRLSMQLAADANATYFSKTNQLASCGCGCG